MSADLIKRLQAHASGHLPLGWTDERMLLEEAAALPNPLPLVRLAGEAEHV